MRKSGIWFLMLLFCASGLVSGCAELYAVKAHKQKQGSYDRADQEIRESEELLNNPVGKKNYARPKETAPAKPAEEVKPQPKKKVPAPAPAAEPETQAVTPQDEQLGRPGFVEPQEVELEVAAVPAAEKKTAEPARAEKSSPEDAQQLSRPGFVEPQDIEPQPKAVKTPALRRPAMAIAPAEESAVPVKPAKAPVKKTVAKAAPKPAPVAVAKPTPVKPKAVTKTSPKKEQPSRSYGFVEPKDEPAPAEVKKAIVKKSTPAVEDKTVVAAKPVEKAPAKKASEPKIVAKPKPKNVSTNNVGLTDPINIPRAKNAPNITPPEDLMGPIVLNRKKPRIAVPEKTEKSVDKQPNRSLDAKADEELKKMAANIGKEAKPSAKKVAPKPAPAVKETPVVVAAKPETKPAIVKAPEKKTPEVAVETKTVGLPFVEEKPVAKKPVVASRPEPKVEPKTTPVKSEPKVDKPVVVAKAPEKKMPEVAVETKTVGLPFDEEKTLAAVKPTAQESPKKASKPSALEIATAKPSKVEDVSAKKPEPKKPEAAPAKNAPEDNKWELEIVDIEELDEPKPAQKPQPVKTAKADDKNIDWSLPEVKEEKSAEKKPAPKLIKPKKAAPVVKIKLAKQYTEQELKAAAAEPKKEIKVEDPKVEVKPIESTKREPVAKKPEPEKVIAPVVKAPAAKPVKVSAKEPVVTAEPKVEEKVPVKESTKPSAVEVALAKPTKEAQPEPAEEIVEDVETVTVVETEPTPAPVAEPVTPKPIATPQPKPIEPDVATQKKVLKANDDFSHAVKGKSKYYLGWPADGMVLRSGMDRLLSWMPADSVDYAGIKLMFSSDGGNSWKTVADSLKYGKIISWKVPAVNSSKCQLRFTGVDESGKTKVLTTSAIFSVDNGSWGSVDDIE